MDQITGLIAALSGYRLYAVYRLKSDGTDRVSYHALFAQSVLNQPYPVRAIGLTIDGGAVTEIAVDCGSLSEAIAGVDQHSFVLPPRALEVCDGAAATPAILCEPGG